MTFAGTKLLLNIRFDQYTTMARQGDQMLRLLCFNFAEDTTAVSSSKPPLSGGVISQQGLIAVGTAGTSAVAPTPTVAVLTPQTYLLKTKDSKVYPFSFALYFSVIKHTCCK